MIGIAPIACAHSAIIRRLFNELSRIHTCAFIRFTPLVSVIHSAINSAIIRCVEMHSHLRLHQVHTARLGLIRREDVKRRVRIRACDARLIHTAVIHHTALRQKPLHVLAPRAVPSFSPMIRLEPARETAVHVELRLGDFGP